MECTKWHPEEGHDVFICRRHVHHRQLQSRRNGRPPAGKNLARRECHRPNFVSVQKNVLSVKQSDLIRECGMNSERDTFTEPPMNDRTREFNNLGSTHNQSLSRRLQIITAVSDNHGQINMCEQRLEGQGPNRYVLQSSCEIRYDLLSLLFTINYYAHIYKKTTNQRFLILQFPKLNNK